MSVLLEADNLAKSFLMGNEKLQVLTHLNLSVHQGDLVCIVGPSGCGKSTLLAQLAGLEKPDSGHIYLNGQEVLKPQKNRIVVFQDFNQLFPWKTVMENILFPLNINKKGSRADRIELAQNYLAKVRLEGFENYHPHQLSGGMKQRVAIARALALESEILLMDEPFGSLDAQSRAELQTLLLEIWNSTGITIVFVTHDLTEALLLANRIVVMGQAPENIKGIFNNSLPWPRTPNDPKFNELYQKVFESLKS